LRTLGVSEENVYLFSQGHTIKENVVLRFLEPLVDAAIASRVAQIRQDTANPKEIGEKINAGRIAQKNIATLLQENTNFQSCFLYEKIKEDFGKYLMQLQRDVAGKAGRNAGK
jgi:hypothetical protein